jgi:predicted nucleotidyltransferase
VAAVGDLEAAILERIRPLTELGALSLFGSRVAGQARPDSDLDVAILPAAPGGEARRRLQTAVAVALADLAPEGRVDVVLLDEAPELLRHNVLSTGRLLFCADGSAWRELRRRTMREHGDREPVRRMLRTAQQRRLLEGRPSGRSGRAVRSFERVGRLSR